ncbi:MAG: hypothetical protein LC739_11165 [Actinobacteria bacterium]|nr:hypothetical protein [Actinomycetota bacterium]
MDDNGGVQKSSRFLLWLLATMATTAIAYVAVNAAGSEVNDQPLTGVIAASPSSSSTSILISTTLQPTTTTTIPGTTSLTSSSTHTSPSTATSAATTSTTATTSPPPVTTAPWQQTTLNSAGGSIIVSYRPEEVRLESVVPQAGFAYEINDEGPDRVEVDFEAGDANYRIRAEWTSDGFVTEIESDD